MIETPTNNGKTNLYPQFGDETQYRLNKINRINEYFIEGLLYFGERETMSKTLSKYTATFDYFDKTLLVS